MITPQTQIKLSDIPTKLYTTKQELYCQFFQKWRDSIKKKYWVSICYRSYKKEAKKFLKVKGITQKDRAPNSYFLMYMDKAKKKEIGRSFRKRQLSKLNILSYSSTDPLVHETKNLAKLFSKNKDFKQLFITTTSHSNVKIKDFFIDLRRSAQNHNLNSLKIQPIEFRARSEVDQFCYVLKRFQRLKKLLIKIVILNSKDFDLLIPFFETLSKLIYINGLDIAFTAKKDGRPISSAELQSLRNLVLLKKQALREVRIALSGIEYDYQDKLIELSQLISALPKIRVFSVYFKQKDKLLSENLGNLYENQVVIQHPLHLEQILGNFADSRLGQLELQLNNVNFESSHFAQYCYQITGFRYLSSFSIAVSNLSCFNDDCAIALGNVLKKLSLTITLCIKMNGVNTIGPKGVAALASGIKTQKKATQVLFDLQNWDKYTDQEMRILFESFCAFEECVHFAVYLNSQKDYGTAAKKKLKQRVYPEVSQQTMLALCQSISCLKKVGHVSVEIFHFDDVSIRGLGRALGNLVYLKNINLKFQKLEITKEGFLPFIESLETINNLEILYLDFNGCKKLEYEDLLGLYNSLKAMLTLKSASIDVSERVKISWQEFETLSKGFNEKFKQLEKLRSKLFRVHVTNYPISSLYN